MNPNDDDTSIPSGHELRVNAAGTPQAEWVVGAEQGAPIGFAAEGTLPITGDPTAVPDETVAVWVAETIGIQQVVLVRDPDRPLVWQVRYAL